MTPALCQIPVGLQLRTLPHPADRSRTVVIFQDWLKACEHLRDHLLTAPECGAWATVIPGYAGLLDPASEDDRWRYLQQASASQGLSAQPLYDLYCDALRGEVEDARLLRWYASDGEVTVAMGTSGILLVIERAPAPAGEVLRTAFLPGQGDPLRTQSARQHPGGPGLPRQGPPCRPAGPRPLPPESPKERRERAQREAHWDDLRRLYYRVFKSAVRFVRRCHRRPPQTQTAAQRRDYALLKDVLPPQSQLKFPHWEVLRDRCRRA